jgi:hypothetical protein
MQSNPLVDGLLPVLNSIPQLVLAFLGHSLFHWLHTGTVLLLEFQD